MLPLLAYLARCCVGVSFVLSAAWKIRHRSEFEAALLAAVRITGLRRTLRFVVPAAEMITPGVLLAPGRPGTIGAAAAGGLVVVLGSTLLRRDLSAGCGCWSAPRVSRGALLTRNAILLVLSAASIPASVQLTWPLALFSLAAGTLFAFLVMEIPSIHQYFDELKAAAP
jgi:hypothetical protein